MVSSWFSVMSCSEITRFHTQLKPVQNYTFFKDPHPFTSSSFREQSVGSVRGYLELLRIRYASAVRTSVIVTHCLLHDQVS